VDIGLGGRQAQRTLHIEGSEVHSGGSDGGFSFADRSTGGFVEIPSPARERWVWYALNGSARLWSGQDWLLINSTGNVGIGTQDPGGAKLDVVSPGTAISGTGATIADEVLGPGIGVTGTGSYGVVAYGTDTGMIATTSGGGLAALFNGNVRISGTLMKGGGGFTIDHPLDPENQYLSHSFVESPEMLNIYRGTVTTDQDGTATVRLPDYVGALNRDFSYQLTVVGEFARAAVASTIEDGAFTVRTDRPQTTVCWLVLGERADPWAEANRITVEEDKSAGEQNLYLHPEVLGHPEAKSALRGQYPDLFEARDAGG
jgi:hypothetical protein